MSNLVITPEQLAQFQAFQRMQQSVPKAPAVVGTVDHDGNFNPSGTIQQKQWNNFRDARAMDYILNKFVPEQFIMSHFFTFLRMAPYGTDVQFYQYFEEQYEANKGTFEEARKKQEETQLAQSKEDENERVETSSVRYQKTYSEVIKLGEGLSFDKSDFQKMMNGKLYLKSEKKSIKLTSSQLQKADELL